jgi:hypothetical protein
MTRTAQRSRRPAATAKPDPAAGNAGTALFEPAQDGWQDPLDLARTLFGVTLRNSREWMHSVSQWQGLQAASLQQATARLDDAAGQAEQATDWPALLALQAELARMQWALAVQDLGLMVDQALQLEDRWLERSQSDAARLAQRAAGDRNGRRAAPVASSLPIGDDNPALAMFSPAQLALNQMSRLWAPAIYNTALPD